jgi:hypothetical protein
MTIWKRCWSLTEVLNRWSKGDQHYQKRTIRKRQQSPIKENDQEEGPITNRNGWLEEDRNHPRKGL